MDNSIHGYSNLKDANGKLSGKTVEDYNFEKHSKFKNEIFRI